MQIRGRCRRGGFICSCLFSFSVNPQLAGLLGPVTEVCHFTEMGYSDDCRAGGLGFKLVLLTGV